MGYLVLWEPQDDTVLPLDGGQWVNGEYNPNLSFIFLQLGPQIHFLRL